MTTLTSSRPLTVDPRGLFARLSQVRETVYRAPAPAAGPGWAAKLRFTAYVVGSAVGWTVATLLVTGLLAGLVR